MIPATSQVTHIAHLLFRVCLANVCPRLETKSNFSCQDVIVVSMLMSGRCFDLSDLILNNMMEVFTSNALTGLLHGLLLTKIFEWYGVDLQFEDKMSSKEFLDNVVFLNPVFKSIKMEMLLKLIFLLLHPRLMCYISLLNWLLICFDDFLKPNYQNL